MSHVSDGGAVMLNRRAFLFGTISTALATTRPAHGQQGTKVYRLALLVNLPPPPAPVATGFYQPFREGLAEGGFKEGENLRIDARWETDISRLAEHARELAHSKPDVIVAFTTPATKAVVEATKKIPIVFTMVSDPIGSGFVLSLSKPGGNVTGVTNIFPETASKLLDHLKEAMGRLERVAVLWNPDNPGKVLDFKELDTAARGMRVQLTSHEVRSPGDFKGVFESIERDRPDALITLVETTTPRRRAPHQA